jgi:DNA-binding transcriptional LysR family regulator
MARVTWKIAATDYSESTVLLPVLPTLRQLAPDSRLAVVQLAPRSIRRQCELGEIDVAFHSADEAPSGLRRKTLFMEEYVLVGRRGHPRLNKRMSVTQFCKLEHVIVSPDGGGFSGVTDAALAQVKLERRVVLGSTLHFCQRCTVEYGSRCDASRSVSDKDARLTVDSAAGRDTGV